MTAYTIAAIILLIILLVVCYILIAYGESETNCVEFSSPHLLVINQQNSFYGGSVDGCDWLVDKVMWNGSGFHIAFYSHSEPISGRDSMVGWQRFIMTK